MFFVFSILELEKEPNLKKKEKKKNLKIFVVNSVVGEFELVVTEPKQSSEKWITVRIWDEEEEEE